MNVAAPQPPETLHATSAQLGPTVMAGLREIWAHKFRSVLTMLGIILGVSSLVSMSALVTGMEKGAKEALIAIGGIEKVRIEPAELPIEQRHLADQAAGITLNDVYGPARQCAAGYPAFAGDAALRHRLCQRQDFPTVELPRRLAGGGGNE